MAILAKQPAAPHEGLRPAARDFDCYRGGAFLYFADGRNAAPHQLPPSLESESRLSSRAANQFRSHDPAGASTDGIGGRVVSEDAREYGRAARSAVDGIDQLRSRLYYRLAMGTQNGSASRSSLYSGFTEDLDASRESRFRVHDGHSDHCGTKS